LSMPLLKRVMHPVVCIGSGFIRLCSVATNDQTSLSAMSEKTLLPSAANFIAQRAKVVFQG
ncbi:hypothetical protein, partial [Klebsiella pneumoniae]|uniref:hypothetical protein n=1 Tax=Klebsiella pneumoniae TaxID=573 RepID=UPI001D0E662A